MPLSTEPLHPLFGVALRGVDFSELPSPLLLDHVRDLMDQHALVVVRDQALNDEQHIALSRAFGPLELPPDYRTGAPRRLRWELYDASNLDANDQLLPADSPRREYNKANVIFHADSTFNDLPTSWSLLLGHVVPPAGGNTEFIDTRAVYDDAPDELKLKIDDLIGVHDLWHSHKPGQHFKVTAEMRRLMPPVEHKIVRHLSSGRKALTIGSHLARIKGWSTDKSTALLDELYDFATQQRYVYSHPWREGDLVIWDNRATLHRAAPWQDNGQVRDLRRTTLLEHGPEIRSTERY